VVPIASALVDQRLIPLSFVVCGLDDEILKSNVLSSPCLYQGCPHEFTVMKICLQAREKGLAVVAIEALCHHNSGSARLPEAIYESDYVLARKWKHRLPIATPCAIIDHVGTVQVLGNATDQPESSAYAKICRRNGGQEIGKKTHHRDHRDHREYKTKSYL
jgi:hypothetical protein